ncbi:membrane-spanning 4-domains subfamily A member 13 [Hyaena hyaena]|uniref:membrane-spanning 4-domains subfamily A member 13 n=1 Tax=Hyaena hyaena TaxID=95912 RepID=UPI001921CA3E|nr:membrane-spanning 4-domains subfamily A member 13 [Hyaena hyaena]XP_039109476.1 membrane-spanning 4-domains subfamily A member 13 [Hyaena hyaena]
MALCKCSKLSTADGLVLGAVQIMIGIFHVLMWYFLLILYMGQIRGVFGTYEPVTYKAGCSLWGVIFIISGVSVIRAARRPTPGMTMFALIMNISCIIASAIASVLTTIELSTFNSVSYRNYGQAKLGREVSRILLLSYPLEISVALVYSVFNCIGLSHHEDTLTAVTEEIESTF